MALTHSHLMAFSGFILFIALLVAIRAAIVSHKNMRTRRRREAWLARREEEDRIWNERHGVNP